MNLYSITTIFINNVCLNLQTILVIEYTYFYGCIYRSNSVQRLFNLKGGEQWISLTGFSSTLKFCSQTPPETVLLRKSMSFIIFLTNEIAFKILV